MGILIIFLVVIQIIVAILLILIILAQDDGSGGAGIMFGSSASQQYGARKGNVITKATSILATIFIVVALSLTFLFSSRNDRNVLSLEEELKTNDTAESATVEWWEPADTNTVDDISAVATDRVEDTAITIPSDNTTGTNDTSEDSSDTENSNATTVNGIGTQGTIESPQDTVPVTQQPEEQKKVVE